MRLSQDEERVMHLVCGGERCLLPHPEKVPCDDPEMGLWRDEMMKWSGGGCAMVWLPAPVRLPWVTEHDIET